MFGCLRRAASNVAQRILQQLLSKLAPPWQHLSSPAWRDKMSSLSALLTWSPRPAKESKGKRKSCPGADSGQTFHTFTGRTRAEKNTSTYRSIKYHHIIIIIIVKTLLSNSQLKPKYRRCIGFLLCVWLLLLLEPIDKKFHHLSSSSTEELGRLQKGWKIHYCTGLSPFDL